MHPDYVLDTLFLERDTGMEKECYMVAPEVEHLVLPELRRTRLHVAITKQGTVFIWPIKLPLEGNDGGAGYSTRPPSARSKPRPVDQAGVE